MLMLLYITVISFPNRASDRSLDLKKKSLESGGRKKSHSSDDSSLDEKKIPTRVMTRVSGHSLDF